MKPRFRSDTKSSEEEDDDEDIEITHPSSHFYKRSKYFGSDGSNGKGASLSQIKKVDDDDEIPVESSFHVMRIPEGLLQCS